MDDNISEIEILRVIASIAESGCKIGRQITEGDTMNYKHTFVIYDGLTDDVLKICRELLHLKFDRKETTNG